MRWISHPPKRGSGRIQRSHLIISSIPYWPILPQWILIPVPTSAGAYSHSHSAQWLQKSAMIGGCAWMSWLSTGGRSPNVAFLTHTRYALAEVQDEGAFSTAAANCIGQRHATL